MECSFFNGAKAVGNLAYGIFRQDPVSVASSGSDAVAVGISCIKKFASKRVKNPFAVDLSDAKFDSSDMARLRRMEAGQRFKDSPLYKEWQREKRLRNRNLQCDIKEIMENDGEIKRLQEEIKRQAGIIGERIENADNIEAIKSEVKRLIKDYAIKVIEWEEKLMKEKLRQLETLKRASLGD